MRSLLGPHGAALYVEFLDEPSKAINTKLGPARTPLARDQILDAALEICRADGFLALTIRRVADHLGVAPMAIYRHFANKAELIGEMLDRVWWQGFIPTDERPADPVDSIVEAFCRVRRHLLDHGEVAMLVAARPQPSEILLRNLDDMLNRFTLAGFDEHHIHQAFVALGSYTLGAVSFEASAGFTERICAIDDDGQALRLAAFDQIVSVDELHRGFVGMVIRGTARDDNFEFGLRRMLDGLLAWAGVGR